MNSKEKIQQKSNREFIKTVSVEYKQWAAKNSKGDDIGSMFEFLISHSFIRQSLINRHRVLREYDIQKHLYPTKQEAIWAVEEVVPVGDVQIKGIIANHGTYFRHNRLKL